MYNESGDVMNEKLKAEIERQAKKILGISWCTVKGFVDKDNSYFLYDYLYY